MDESRLSDAAPLARSQRMAKILTESNNNKHMNFGLQSRSPVYSLKTRTLILSSILLLLSAFGLFLLNQSQDKILTASKEIRQVLIPASRLFEEAKGELDLQSQELLLMNSSQSQSELSEQSLGLLRLGPAVKSLLQLYQSPVLPASLRPLMEPWIKGIEDYQMQYSKLTTVSQGILKLKSLRQKTHLLHRALERELSLQLLKLSESANQISNYWSAALLCACFATLIFLMLLWKWMAPLENMKEWLKVYRNIDGENSFLNAPPPPSVLGRGPLAPPAEVQELVDALRFHLAHFKNLAKDLKKKSEENRETERSITTLFTGFQYLLRHNQDLLSELIKKEKLASMGEMAAQLAHEIRNPLNSLNLKLELLREDLQGKDREKIDRVLGEIDRLNALTESQLQVAKYKPHNSEALHQATLKECLDDVLDLFQTLAHSKNIQLSTDTLENLDFSFHPLPPTVLKSCLVNVIKNAIESFETTSVQKKEIKIKVSLTIISSQNQELSISILDNGAGFSPEWLTHPFKIFQSAKSSGTGLGLNTCVKMLEPYQFKLVINQDLEEKFATSVSLKGPIVIEKNKYQNSILTDGQNWNAL